MQMCSSLMSKYVKNRNDPNFSELFKKNYKKVKTAAGMRIAQ